MNTILNAPVHAAIGSGPAGAMGGLCKSGTTRMRLFGIVQSHGEEFNIPNS
jgi:hypothetical protein